MRIAFGPLVRYTTIATLAGLIAGVLGGGLGSRIAMRVTALMTEQWLQGSLTEAHARVGEITSEGSLFLMLIGGILGVYGGFLYTTLARPFPLPTAQKGALFGCYLLLLHGSLIIEGDNIDFTRFGLVTVNLSMFLLIPILFGVLVSYVSAWLEQRFPVPQRTVASIVWQLPALFGIGILLILSNMMIQTITDPYTYDGLFTYEQAIIAISMVVVMVLNMLLRNLSQRTPNVVWFQGVIAMSPALYGGMLLIRAIQHILA